MTLRSCSSALQGTCATPARRRCPTRCQAEGAGISEYDMTRRRALQLATSIVALPLFASPAMADEGFNPLRAVLRAPADFYRSRQQANGGAKILAPIRASRMRLEECQAMLQEGASEEAYGRILQGVRAASLNCYLYEVEAGEGLEARASLLQQQLPLGEPCTFRLLRKNSLTLVTDPELERQADESLDLLLRTFQLLDDMAERAKQGDPTAAQAVPSLLEQCINANLQFEATVKACIGLPA